MSKIAHLVNRHGFTPGTRSGCPYGSLAHFVPKPLKVPGLAHSIPKLLKLPCFVHFVQKPLKVPSFARSVPKPLLIELREAGGHQPGTYEPLLIFAADLLPSWL